MELVICAGISNISVMMPQNEIGEDVQILTKGFLTSFLFTVGLK
uniref:Uncharacterized protein n=1 Tax=Anguilla anguilla TaxID=7936 RepID=A0A0E9XL95_ANGAN